MRYERVVVVLPLVPVTAMIGILADLPGGYSHIYHMAGNVARQAFALARYAS